MNNQLVLVTRTKFDAISRIKKVKRVEELIVKKGPCKAKKQE